MSEQNSTTENTSPSEARPASTVINVDPATATNQEQAIIVTQEQEQTAAAYAWSPSAYIRRILAIPKLVIEPVPTVTTPTDLVSGGDAAAQAPTQTGGQINDTVILPVYTPRHQSACILPPPNADFSAPPPYDAIGGKLPTYDEVQREKVLQGEIPPSEIVETAVGARSRCPYSPMDPELALPRNDTHLKLLGTDLMFVVAFVVSLLFNWIGFLLIMCFCHTIAARYGALSGFGLSLAKWTLIVRNNNADLNPHSMWLWWFITAFGILVCVRSLFQYFHLKRGWRLMSPAMQERYMFVY